MSGTTHRLLLGVVLAALLVVRPGITHGAAASTLWNPRIAIVWPHDAQGNQTAVASSSFVNVSIWPTNQVSCAQGPNPPVDLFVAKNNEPVHSVGIAPQIIQRSVNGASFPSAEFNNVPANLAVDPTAKYRFVTYSGGQPQGNIWVHAADPRTFFPQQLVPTGYSEPSPNELDTRIQVVWPHDEQGNFAPVDRATRVNIAVDVFAHGTTHSLPPDTLYNLKLLWAQGNGPLAQAPGVAQKMTYTVNGKTFPRWVVNNFPVQPGQQYHFLFLIGALGQPGASFPTIWTHAADARTILPQPEPPPSCTS